MRLWEHYRSLKSLSYTHYTVEYCNEVFYVAYDNEYMSKLQKFLYV